MDLTSKVDEKSIIAQPNGIISENSSYVPVDGEVDLASKGLKAIPSPLFGSISDSILSLNLNYNDLKCLPDELCKCLTHLRFLGVKGNEMLELPQNIGLLGNLQTLDACENKFTTLPESVSRLERLTRLTLTGNCLDSLPDCITRLANLEELYLDENNLVVLPDGFENLKRIRRLEITDNKLRKLPLKFGSLREMVHLDLSCNFLDDLPESFGDLPNLEVVDLSRNRIKQLPARFRSANRLVKLYVEVNQLFALPAWFSELYSLEELTLGDNALRNTPFPPDFGKTSSKLKKFNVATNNLTDLPETFGFMTELEFVHIGSSVYEVDRSKHEINGNLITKLPENFGRLVLIRNCRLEENQLLELPESFGQLVNMETLDLGRNALTQLPSSFGQLRSLQTCVLSKNFLKTLPESFGNLIKLTELRLDNNMLLELPESFRNLTSLKSLDLFNNRLTAIPACLMYLSSIRFLDLDENDIDAPIEDIPHILFKTSYPKRNPDLKDNWRGKSRPDIVDLSGSSSEAGLTEAENAEAAKIAYLTTALRQGSSLWKSHSDIEGKRQKFEHKHDLIKDGSRTGAIGNENALAIDDVSSCWDNDESQDCRRNRKWAIDQSSDSDSDPDYYSYDDGIAKDSDAAPATGSEIPIQEEMESEDWEAEMEKDNPFNVYDDFDQFKAAQNWKLQWTEPSSDFYCPAKGHVQNVMRCCRLTDKDLQKMIRMGQFEDAVGDRID